MSLTDIVTSLDLSKKLKYLHRYCDGRSVSRNILTDAIQSVLDECEQQKSKIECLELALKTMGNLNNETQKKQSVA